MELIRHLVGASLLQMEETELFTMIYGEMERITEAFAITRPIAKERVVKAKAKGKKEIENERISKILEYSRAYVAAKEANNG